MKQEDKEWLTALVSGFSLGVAVMFVLLATFATLLCGAYSAMFWGEMAAYVTIYTAMFLL